VPAADPNAVSHARHWLLLAALALPNCSAPLIVPSRATDFGDLALLSRFQGGGFSWMLPQAKSVKELLYVSYSPSGSGTVDVFDYRRQTLVGRLAGFAIPSGQCVDKKGDVWITDASGPVVEYAHGGLTPLKELSPGGSSAGCSVAPNGDLAVSNNEANTYSDLGNVEIWKHAAGTPVIYQSNTCNAPLSPGYDIHGNLYVESSSWTGGNTSVCEIAAHAASNALQHISVSPAFQGVGGVQWDGRYLTLSSSSNDYPATTLIYRTEPSGLGLKMIGITVLNDSCSTGGNTLYQPFIVGKTNTPVNREEGTAVVGGNVRCADPTVDFWNYPGGGNPWKALITSLSSTGQPEGASVSIAP
jgi:hypothetical protein